MHDAVVVGGGPAGSRAAALLARDLDVLVLEEHPVSGTPLQCAGLVTGEVINLSGVRPEILSTLHGAEVFFPDGSSVTVRSDSPKAYSIDRAALDAAMAEAAMDAGAVFSYGERCTGCTCRDSAKVSTSKGEHSARIVIGADGARSVVGRSLLGGAPHETIRGIQAEINRRMEHQDRFVVRFGSDIAPGFFAWEIPCGDTTRVGLCSTWSAGPPMQYLRRLLSRIGAEDRVLSLQNGIIPLGGRDAIVGDRCALVGDAAVQVKPVSGGGLFPGLTAAGILADTVREAMAEGDLSGKRLRGYSRGCCRAFGKELKRGYALRKMLLRMDDSDLNRAGRYARREDVRSILDGLDIDHPSEVTRQLIRHPVAAISALPLLRCIL